MTNTLIARFSKMNCKIQLHAPSCSLVAAFDGSEPVVEMRAANLFRWTEEEKADAAEMGHPVTVCKCAKGVK